MTAATALALTDAEVRQLAAGHLDELSPAQQAERYRQVCTSLGLNPLTSPLGLIKLDGHVRLYVLKDGAEQLARIHKISTEIRGRELWRDDGLFIAQARAHKPTGEYADADGAVSILARDGTNYLKGEALANAYMKASTKATRRAILRLAGLGMLDESETDTLPPNTTVMSVPRDEIDDARTPAEMLDVLQRAVQDEPKDARQPSPSEIQKLRQDFIAAVGMNAQKLMQAITGADKAANLTTPAEVVLIRWTAYPNFSAEARTIVAWLEGGAK